MGRDSKKASKWEDIEEERRNKLIDLRKREINLLEESGSNKIKNFFFSGYASYSILLLALIKFRNKKLNNKTLALMIGPIAPYLFLLTKVFGNIDKYREYFEVREELNKLLKKSSKSSEYK